MFSYYREMVHMDSKNFTCELLVASVLLKLRTHPHFRWYLKEMGAERTSKIA